MLLRLDNGEGEKAWVETRIEDYVEVRNAEKAEHRYRVSLPLECGGVKKVAMVNLNDRSRMTYRLLLGRDFLRDDFVWMSPTRGRNRCNHNELRLDVA